MSTDNIARIEDRIDRAAAGATEIKMDMGGVQFRSMIELMEFAKLMSVSGAAVPHHLRANPGACLAICTKALRFGFDPFSLAEHSYLMVKSSKVDGQWQDIETIAYDSFVIRAIIQAHAPLTGRLRETFDKEGDERTCTVTAIPRGEKEPLSHTSPAIGKIKAARGRNDKGALKGSPLWDTKPDVQLSYDTQRDFCRKHFPEILLGWYDKEELEEYEGRTIEVPKPDIASRLKGTDTAARGFSQEHVTKELAAPTETPLNVVSDGAKPEPVKEPAKSDIADIPAHLDRRRKKTEPTKAKEPEAPAPSIKAQPDADPADETAEWLDEQIAIANNVASMSALDELDPRVWKRISTEKRDKDLGAKWESEGYDPNRARIIGKK